MSLTSQIVEKIRLMLDKPATSLNFKHLTELINKQLVPQEQLISLLLYKERADLILFVLQRFAITPQQLEGVIASVLKNILKYQLEDLRKIWKTILKKEIFKMWRQKWGVHKLIHDAFKITNQTIKEVLFELLASNVQVLIQLNQNKIVQAFVKNYIASYLKYNIYLPPVPLLASKCLIINSLSHFNFLQIQIKKQLLQRTLSFLAATIQRKVYTYQNNCISFVTLLIRQQQQNIADMLDIYECEKVLQFYLYKKSTREQARKMQQMVEKYREKISKDQKDKMNYNYEIKHKSEQYQTKKVPLIENVIDKTNNYQLKKRGVIVVQSIVSPPQQKNINFLRKGIGNGGGKAEVRSYKSPSEIVKFNAIQQIVDNCFLQSELKIGEASPSRQLLNIGQNREIIQSKEYGEADDNRTVSVYESNIEDEEEWTEISTLIDLAYQYKFG